MKWMSVFVYVAIVNRGIRNDAVGQIARFNSLKHLWIANQHAIHL